MSFSNNIKDITPIRGLATSHNMDYRWQSITDEPIFEINHAANLHKGWYVIEIRIKSEANSGNAKLYFSYDDNFKTEDEVAIHFFNGRLTKRIYNLKNKPKHTYFCPLNFQTNFSIIHIKLTPILTLWAYYRLFLRFKNYNYKTKSEPLITTVCNLAYISSKKNTTIKSFLFDFYNKTIENKENNQSLDYSEWILLFEEPELKNTKKLLKSQANFKIKPVISVLVVATYPSEAHLLSTVKSVMSQSYPFWELCILFNAENLEKSSHKKLKAFSESDLRIKLFALNHYEYKVSDISIGKYFIFLNQHSEISPHAFHFIVKSINQNKNAKILYSDEDKINHLGERLEPNFKPDWNPDLFLSLNYICNLCVFSNELAKENALSTTIKNTNEETILNFLFYLKQENIIHIPRVLYHERMPESLENKINQDESLKCRINYFKNLALDNTVKVNKSSLTNIFRVTYPIPDPTPLVTLLIPTRDMLETLEPCVRSIIKKTTYLNYELLILDNGSIEQSTHNFFISIQNEDCRVKVISYNYPFNYSAINNYGVNQANGTLIGLINNDIEVINPEWLAEMISHSIRPEVGCVGAKLYYDDQTIQHAGVILGLGGIAGHSHKHYSRQDRGYFERLLTVQNLSAVTAACLIVRKEIFEQVGGLEEGLPVAFNDVDLCLKIREAGYLIVWTPYAELYHHESKSRGTDDTPEKIQRSIQEKNFIKKKWGKKIESDPYYNINLSLFGEDFSI